MTADVVVARELKSLQEELSASQKERAAAPAGEGAMPPAPAALVAETPEDRELGDRALEAVVEQLNDVKANITAVVHNPLDAAAQKILIPAALSIVRGLRAKKEHS